MSIKRTISFAEDTLVELDRLIPKSKRSRFVNDAVVAALQQEAKERALQNIEQMEKYDISDSGVVETVREARKEEASRL